jgi:hypothetical protein
MEKNLTKEELEIRAEIRAKDISNLKARLKAYGYYTDNLWSTDDVKDRLREYGLVCSEEMAQTILKKCVSSEYITAEINDMIEDEVRQRFPKYEELKSLSNDEENE